MFDLNFYDFIKKITTKITHSMCNIYTETSNNKLNKLNTNFKYSENTDILSCDYLYDYMIYFNMDIEKIINPYHNLKKLSNHIYV